jgi:hypothetical protein
MSSTVTIIMQVTSKHVGSDLVIVNEIQLTPQTARLKSPRAFAAGSIALGAAVWYGDYCWTAGRLIETTDDAYIAGNITTISSWITEFLAIPLLRNTTSAGLAAAPARKSV